MSRPTTEPQWATDSTFTTGPIIGQPNKATPSGGLIAEGFVPAAGVAAEHLNWKLGQVGSWLGHLNSRKVINEVWNGTFDVTSTTSVLGDRWAAVSSGSGRIRTTVPSSASYPSPYLTLSSTATDTSKGEIATADDLIYFDASDDFSIALEFEFGMATAGANNNSIAAGLVAEGGFYFYKNSTDTNWQVQCGGGSPASTGVAPVTGSNPTQHFTILVYGSGTSLGVTTAKCYIDGVLTNTITTGIVDVALPLEFRVQASAASNALDVYLGPVLVAWE